MSHNRDITGDAALVIAAATELCGDANVATEWFHVCAIDVFRGRTAEQLVFDGRADDVLAYIQTLDAGALG